MTIKKEDDILKLYQGDSGSLKVIGIPTDKNYQVYFQVQTKNREPIEPQIVKNSDFKDFVILPITTELTDKLAVRSNRTYEIYTYGIKLCHLDGQIKTENTVSIKGQNFGSYSYMHVYPKKVEGPA